jgi:hypothetical protein
MYYLFEALLKSEIVEKKRREKRKKETFCKV